MEKSEQSVKYCCYCHQEKPTTDFYKDKRGIYSSRCRRCHGQSKHVCVICGDIFWGKPNKKVCSNRCHKVLRPQTFRLCQYCGREYGPLNHLNQKFCSKDCKFNAQRTGRRTLRRTHRWARRAHNVLRYHVNIGHVVRPEKCEECGIAGKRIEGAHSNYDEPLNVRWLCRSCHARWDKHHPKYATYLVCPDYSGRHRPSKDFTGEKAILESAE